MPRGIPVSKREYEEYCTARTWGGVFLWFVGSGTAAICWVALEKGHYGGAIFCGLIALGCFGAVLIDYLAGPEYIRSLTDEVMKGE
jgi:hypothetical protein